jgi:sensor histidine kinase regulating citrate/malate metabolism
VRWPIRCYRVRLTRALANLLVNSGEAVSRRYETEQKGLIAVLTVDEGDHVRIEVQDDGDGISPENSQHLFKKGFSTNGGDGRGYGLSIVQEIVEGDHAGKVVVKSTPNVGTTVTVLIPKTESSPRVQGRDVPLRAR